MCHREALVHVFPSYTSHTFRTTPPPSSSTTPLPYRSLDLSITSSLFLVIGYESGIVTALNPCDGTPSIKSFKYMWYLGKFTKSASAKTG